jgi:hypothetical protein
MRYQTREEIIEALATLDRPTLGSTSQIRRQINCDAHIGM